jgi:transposase-like protein
MRYSPSEKLEIIRLVEQSHLSVRRTLAQLGIPKSTFCGWYRRFVEGGFDALEDQPSGPAKVWNKVPDETAKAVVELALVEPALSPREVAVKFTDTAQYYVSESTVYRLLKAQDLIASPAFIVMQAADKFSQPTTRVNQLWQTDFTYLKVIGWGWFYLSTVLDDYSRFILAWRLCTGMAASDNGPSYVSGELADWLERQNMTHTRGRPYHPMTQGKIERWHRAMKNQILLENYYLPG